MIGVFDYTTLFTFMGTMCGVFSIYFSLSGKIEIGVLLLLISGFFDALDGTVARTKKSRTEFEKNYGVELDSLSDVICFGLAPMFLGFKIASGNIALQILSVIYLFTALSRLAWFNVDEWERRKKEKDARKTYTGLPVTPSSIIFPTVYLLKDLLNEAFPSVYIGVLLVVAYLQLSKIQVPHLKWKGQLICVVYGIAILSLLIIFIL